VSASAHASPVTLKSLTNVSCAAISPDGNTLAVGGAGERVGLWDIPGRRLRATLNEHPKEIRCLAFSPDGGTLAVGCYRQVRLWDVKTARERVTLKGHTTHVERVQFSPDGKTLFTASREEAKLWHLASADELATLKSNAARWVLSPDGQTVLSYNHYWNTVDVWDVAKRANRPALRSGWTGCVACTADGRVAASGSSDTVRLWDTASGKQRGSHNLHAGYVTSVDISPDGSTLVSGSRDRTALVWDIATKKERATLKGHSGDVIVSFSRDGRMLYSYSPRGQVVYLWDAAGRRRGVLAGHRAGILFIAASPDGRTLAVACRDRTIRLWDVAAALTAE
jgi:WD40 repeat protein